MEELFGEADIPDLYVDSVRMAVGAYGITMELGLQGVQDTPGSEPPPIKRLALIRMSPQHALILWKIIKLNMDKYQADIGKIELPPELFKLLGIEPD